MGSSEVTRDAPRRDEKRLDEWVASHGSLSVPHALIIALHLCARVSQLTRPALAASIDSLNSAGIVREDGKGWGWAAVSSAASASEAPDSEVVARIGAVLLHSLSGEAAASRFDSERAVRAMLRSRRPDLPANVIDLVARAATTTPSSKTSLAAFAREVRQTLGLDAPSPERSARLANRGLIAAAAAFIIVALFAADYGLFGGPRPESQVLTADETVAMDILSETAQTMALIDEHTASIRTYQDIAQLLSTRMGLEDPRLDWNAIQEAWVRTLAGDRLTAEQRLESMVSELSRHLGNAHPYTRTARLDLADTLEARGAKAEADGLRSEAALATQALFRSAAQEDVDFDPAPVAPGVVAHVAPNAPGREGFRPATGHGFLVPLTSTQRSIAGRDGWRMHLRATGRCTVSFDVGAEPHTVAVNMFRSVSGRWLIRVDGARPAATLDGGDAPSFEVSLAGDGSGLLKATLGGDTVHALRIDASSSPATPPYALTFDDASTCAVVWLEIPFPPQSTFRRSTTPPLR